MDWGGAAVAAGGQRWRGDKGVKVRSGRRQAGQPRTAPPPTPPLHLPVQSPARPSKLAAASGYPISIPLPTAAADCPTQIPLLACRTSKEAGGRQPPSTGTGGSAVNSALAATPTPVPSRRSTLTSWSLLLMTQGRQRIEIHIQYTSSCSLAEPDC